MLSALPGLGYAGVIVEGMGAGHVPADAAPMLGDLAAKIPVVLVTNQVSEIIPEMDRVVLLQRGHLAADGPKQEVLTSEQLSSLFGVPVRLFRDDDYFYVHA